MQLDVFLGSSALSDLVDIWIYISENSASDVIADRFVDRIKARCEKIGNAPQGGRPRDDILPGLRIVPFEHSAVILYVVENDRVRITDIFYGGREYESLLGEKP